MILILFIYFLVVTGFNLISKETNNILNLMYLPYEKLDIFAYCIIIYFIIQYLGFIPWQRKYALSEAAVNLTLKDNKFI